MRDHEVGHCESVQDMLDGIAELCERLNVTGIAVVLSYQDGANVTTHQFGMGDNELAIAAMLMADYAKGSVVHYAEN